MLFENTATPRYNRSNRFHWLVQTQQVQLLGIWVSIATTSFFQDGVTIFIDKKAQLTLLGTEMDYQVT